MRNESQIRPTTIRQIVYTGGKSLLKQNSTGLTRIKMSTNFILCHVQGPQVVDYELFAK